MTFPDVLDRICKELCPELASCKPGELESAKLPVLKNVITVDSKQDGCFTWEEAFAKSVEVPYSEVEARRKISK